MEVKQLSDAEIIDSLLKEIRFSANQFSKKLGYSSHSTIYHILKGRNQISDEMIDNIIKHFPQVSYWFLKKGKFPIVLDNKNLQINQNKLFSTTEHIANKIDYDLESFEVLKSIEVLLKRLVELEEKKINL